MLVVSRCEGEEVIIGDPEKPLGRIKVTEIRGERVRLGFDFPEEVDIYRKELADEIISERKNAFGHSEDRPKDYSCIGGRIIGMSYC